jgi:hypothetical protein
VRVEKIAMSSQSTGAVSSFFSHQSKIKQMKETLRQRDEEQRQRDEMQRAQYEAMRKRDDYYAQAFAQQQLSFTLVNYFIRYRAHINTFKTNCIATCIEMAQQQGIQLLLLEPPPPLPPFGQPLQAPIRFLSLDFQFFLFLFIFLLFLN